MEEEVLEIVINLVLPDVNAPNLVTNSNARGWSASFYYGSIGWPNPDVPG